MKQVVCFGEALIDFLAEAPRTGAPQGFLRYAGGAPANAAVAVARLGLPSAFVGMLGEDAFGDFLLASLEQAGVGTGYVVRTGAANTALAFVSLDARGERRFSFYRPPAADLLFRAGDFQERCFAGAAAFHVCSNSLTEEGIAAATLEGVRRARAAGALVSFDVNYRPGLWPTHTDARPRLWSVLHEADVVKFSVSELEYLAEPMEGEAAVVAELWRGKARWILVTDGPAPLRSFTRQGEIRLPAFKVDCVNATGAGDAFVAGLLGWLLQGGVDLQGLATFLSDGARLRDCLRFAAACGALAVTRHGAFEAMPRRAEVEALLTAQP